MEELQKHFKSAKNWNMVLLVLGIIIAVMQLFSLPTNLNPKRETYEMAGSMFQNTNVPGMEAYMNQMYEYVQSPMTKAIFIVSLVVAIVLLVFYIRAHKALKNNNVPPKWPYYVFIGWTIISTVLGMVRQPKLESGSTLITVITGLVGNFIILIPAVIVIVQLFKIEPEE